MSRDPRVLGYCRVSTEDQAREGVSLSAQEAKIRAYCELNDLELVEIHTDAGISAKTLAARPALQVALKLLEVGYAGGLVVLKLDRLSRSTRDVLSLVETFESQGTALHSIGEKLDTRSAAGRFVLTILAALAQMEREQIGERTSMALQHKRSRGERLGTTPLGYQTVPGPDGKNQLVPFDEEMTLLLRIKAMRHEGMYTTEIARVLNSEGVPSKRGARWHSSTICYLLRHIIPRLG